MLAAWFLFSILRIPSSAFSFCSCLDICLLRVAKGDQVVEDRIQYILVGLARIMRYRVPRLEYDPSQRLGWRCGNPVANFHRRGARFSLLLFRRCQSTFVVEAQALFLRGLAGECVWRRA